MQKYQAVIFDLDGVLVHSTPLHDRAYRLVLAGYGVHDFDYQPFAGRKTLDSIRLLNQQHQLGLSEEELQKAAQQKTAFALEMLTRENPIADGCRELLDGLRPHVKLALASSASPESIDLFLNLNQLRSHFDSVLSSADVVHAKPSPEIYLQSCRKLDVDPSMAAVIEDAVAGVEAGRAAGTTVYGILTTYAAPALLAAGAVRCVDSLAQLLPLLLEQPA